MDLRLGVRVRVCVRVYVRVCVRNLDIDWRTEREGKASSE